MSFYDKIRLNLPNSKVGDLVCVDSDSYLIDIDGYQISFCSSDIRDDGFKKFSNLYRYKSFVTNAEKVESIFGRRFKFDFNQFKSVRTPMTVYDIISGQEFKASFGNLIRGSIPDRINFERIEAKINDFKQRAAAIHSSFYSYDNVEYKNSDTKVSITCPIHGDFSQTPHDHLSGHGCPKCKSDKAKLSLEEFISRARSCHSIDYDYSFVRIDNYDTPIKIICPIHGEFEQTPRDHLSGSDCPKCSREKMYRVYAEDVNRNLKNTNVKMIDSSASNMSEESNFLCSKHGEFRTTIRRALSSESSGCKECKKENVSVSFGQFVERSKLIHGNKYIYIEEDFYLNKSINVICHVHGEFKTYKYNHLNGSDCPKCSAISTGLKSRLTQEEFIDRASSFNPLLKFEYGCYTKNSEEAVFTCSIHGKQRRKAQDILQGHGCRTCLTNRPEQEILNEIRSVYQGEVIAHSRPKFMNGMELDFYIPKKNLAIEFNGTVFHHSSKNTILNGVKPKPYNYHYNKWLLCNENGINLISIHDFYWADDLKNKIIRSKIRHYLGCDRKVYARKCVIKEVSNKVAAEFYSSTHIEGPGFPYRNSKSFGLFLEDELLMCVTIGEFYNQSKKCFELKVSRISTQLDITVTGGLTKLLGYLKNTYGEFKYQFTLGYGGSTSKVFNYDYIGPRYFWVNPKTLSYFSRNQCQKHMLEKSFGEKLLPDDTESTYMERLGYVKVFDCGVAELSSEKGLL